MNVDSYRRREAIDKSRGAGRPPSKATLKSSALLSRRDNHANAAAANYHPDCRAALTLIVALQPGEYDKIRRILLYAAAAMLMVPRLARLA
jgi:hypothetical protein